MYLLFYDYVEDVAERRTPYREAHLALIHDWKADGRIVMAGAVGDPPHSGLFVFDVEDPQVIDEFTDADPYGAAGLVTSRRVERWNVV